MINYACYLVCPPPTPLLLGLLTATRIAADPSCKLFLPALIWELTRILAVPTPFKVLPGLRRPGFPQLGVVAGLTVLTCTTSHSKQSTITSDGGIRKYVDFLLIPTWVPAVCAAADVLRSAPAFRDHLSFFKSHAYSGRHNQQGLIH